MKIVKPKIGSIDIPSDKPKLILDDNRNRKAFVIFNNGSDTIELLSSPQQKYGDGMPIPAGLERYNDKATGSYWAISASGQQNARIEEDVEEDVSP